MPLEILKNDDRNGDRVTLGDNLIKINKNFAQQEARILQAQADVEAAAQLAQEAKDLAAAGGGGGGLPPGPQNGDVLFSYGGVPSWKNLAQAVKDVLPSINLFPNVPPVSVTSVEDQFVSGNVLTGATTLTGTLRVLDYTVPTVSRPDGLKFTAGVTSVTNPLGTFTLNQDGSWTLYARMYSSGTMPTIRYTVTNGITEPVTGTLQFYLTWVNHAPVTSPDSVTTTDGSTVTINALVNDIEWDGQAMTITKLNGLPITAGGPAVAVTNASVQLTANGQTLLVTPTTGFNGLITLNYSVADTLGVEAIGIVYVMVTNSAAAATSNYVTGKNVLIPFDFAANPIAKNGIVYEPTTGATIKRITDVTQDMPGQVALFNAYSRYPTENITQEYCLAFASNSTTVLVIDRASGGVIATLAYDNTGLPSHTIGAYHEVRWHYTLDHPYRVYYVRGQQFWMIDDVRNQNATRVMIKDFSTVIDWLDLPDNVRQIYMDQEGNSSLDSDRWGWMAVYYDTVTAGFAVRAYLNYQISTDTVNIMYPADMLRFDRIPGNEETLKTFRHRPNMVEITPDGSGMVIHHERAYGGNRDAYIGTIFEAPYIFPLDFQPSTFQPFRIGSDATHSGWSTVGGVWHYVAQDNRRDTWCAVPISGPNKGYGNEGYIDVNGALSPGVIDFYHDNDGMYPGTHFGVCTNAADGWTLVSTYTTQKVNAYGMANSDFLMQIKPAAEAIIYKPTPSCNQYPAADKQDWNESPGSINLAGTRIYTCGDWNGTFPLTPDGKGRYCDLFSIDLPPNWADQFVPSSPVKKTDPTVSGDPTQGQTLTAVDATFTGFPMPVVTGIWQRGNVSTGVWTDIPGATALTYLESSADVGYKLRRRTHGQNASGSLDVFSPEIGPVAGLPVPAVVTAPSISGLAQEGSVLTGNDGAYTNSPTSFIRKWFRLNPTTSAIAQIIGEAGTTYTQTAADIGFKIIYEVTPHNGYGDGDPQRSAPTAAVVADPGIISRVTQAVSVDPSPGSNTSTRQSAAFDVLAGDLIVVSIDWNTNAGANTGVSVADTLVSDFTAGSVASHTGFNGRAQQFWAVAAADQVGNVVTATNASISTPLNVSVAVYRASSGTTWTHTGEVTLSTEYVPYPVTTPVFDMDANSVAVSHWFDLYGITGTVTSADTIVHTVQGTSWTIERRRGIAASGTSMTSSCSGASYTRMAASVQIFKRT